MNAMDLTLCVPMYNESAIIENTARTLSGVLSRLCPNHELLFVDDGSTDGSAGLVEALALPRTRVIAYQPNRGKGCAVRTGMLAARGEIALFLDADLAYGTEVIGQALELLAARPEAEILIGSRAIHPEGYAGYTFMRKLASKVYLRLLRMAGGLPYSDCQCGLKAFRQSVREPIFSRCVTDGFAFDLEAMLWARELGCTVCELPVKIVNHRASKVSLFRDSLELLGEFRRIPKRVAAERKAEQDRSRS